MVDDTRTQVIEAHSHPSLDWYAREIHTTSVSTGHWDDTEVPSMDKIAAKIMLVVTELSEVVEALRKDKGADKIVEEIADSHIRLLDLYGALWKHDLVDVSLQESLDKKCLINKHRPVLHGHKWG